MPGKPGKSGPVPKRSEERIRRNTTEYGTIDRVNMIGDVEVPDLGIPNVHPMIEDFYESLKQSGQAKYYEPSDWQFARYTMHFADRLVKSGKPSSQMLAAVNNALQDLLVSEGQRRRVRMEVEREQAKGEVIDVAAMFRERMDQGA